MTQAANHSQAGLGRLAAIGAATWADLVVYLPRRYKDYTRYAESFAAAYAGASRNPAEPARRTCMRLRVLETASYDRDGQVLGSAADGRPFRLSLKVQDQAGQTGWLSAFGNLHPWRGVEPGSEIEVAGQIDLWNGRWQLRNAERIEDAARGRVVPIYRGEPGYLASASVARGVARALEAHLPDAVARICDALGEPEPAIDRIVGCPEGLRGALRTVHYPESLEKAEEARSDLRRLEALAVLRQARETESRPEEPASAIALASGTLRGLAAGLPYTLTGDQRQALNEIVADLHSARPMRRLLTGEVGCGKSICFQIPAVACHNLGRRTVILAPGQLMLEQLLAEFERFFPGSPVAAVSAERKPDRAALAGNPILVGTTALLNWCRAHRHVADFLVVDEQHRHSREIREALLAPHTNLLEATATPVPRSLALVTHGGMDVSMLRTAPVVKRIETRIVLGTEEPRLVDFVERALAAGWRLAVVYGRVEDDGDGELRSVQKELANWNKRFPGKVGMVHGRLSERQKDAVIRRFREGEISLLVASTVIELGLTLPSLRAMVVVNADRFGLATLHQLRGRLAREGGPGKFLMFLPKDVGEDARKRLEALVQTEDGFVLAEMDMCARGFGDLSSNSEAQTGRHAGIFCGLVVTPSDLEEAQAITARSPRENGFRHAPYELHAHVRADPRAFEERDAPHDLGVAPARHISVRREEGARPSSRRGSRAARRDSRAGRSA